MTHICISKLTNIGSDNDLPPGRSQAIIWINAGLLSIGTLRTDFSEILSKIYTFTFKKMPLKMLSVKWQPFCLCLNVLKEIQSCCLQNVSHFVLASRCSTSDCPQQGISQMGHSLGCLQLQWTYLSKYNYNLSKALTEQFSIPCHMLIRPYSHNNTPIHATKIQGKIMLTLSTQRHEGSMKISRISFLLMPWCQKEPGSCLNIKTIFPTSQVWGFPC